MLTRKRGFYEKYVKRLLDILCALLAIILFSWLYLILAVIVRVKMGSPVFFRQPRPGMISPKTGREQIFNMHKFRTMADQTDDVGDLLPDDQRLTPFGRVLRATSFDELPEVFNILKGDMSVVGPRPMLVRDMVFMDDEIRRRHTAKPGLTGLAQVNGRNAIPWEKKFEWDLKYIEKVTFLNDLRIVCRTFLKVFGKTETSQEIEVTDDYGDALLKAGKITREEYDAGQARAKELIREYENNRS
jgi:lipopolysaccharide/colanic/teichoic acid biosynthesis glycosyltransferase